MFNRARLTSRNVRFRETREQVLGRNALIVLQAFTAADHRIVPVLRESKQIQVLYKSHAVEIVLVSIARVVCSARVGNTSRRNKSSHLGGGGL